MDWVLQIVQAFVAFVNTMLSLHSIVSSISSVTVLSMLICLAKCIDLALHEKCSFRGLCGYDCRYYGGGLAGKGIFA